MDCDLFLAIEYKFWSVGLGLVRLVPQVSTAPLFTASPVYFDTKTMSLMHAIKYKLKILGNNDINDIAHNPSHRSTWEFLADPT